MKNILVVITLIFIFSLSISYAKIYDTESEVFEDTNLPFSDLQIPVILKRTGEQKENKQGKLIFKYHPYINEIIKANKLGFIEGFTDGTFGPDKTITRAQFIKIVVELAVNKNFDYGAIPISTSHWVGKWLAVAEMQNIIKKDQFSYDELDKPITRIEMICILSNTQINMKGIDLFTDANLSYTDISDLTEKERELLLHACKYELLDGMTETDEIRPHDNLTRGEAVRAILRIY